MTKPNAFLWPAASTLTFRDFRGREYFSSRDRRLDLPDSLMGRWDNRTVYLGLKTNSPKWVSWTEDNVSAIENLVRYDLSFDGYRVRLERLDAVGQDQRCVDEFHWKVVIRSK